MAGGNFDINVGKDRAGNYVNTKSKRQQKPSVSARGIYVVPLIGYDWGPNGEFIKLSVESPDAEIAKLGRSVYDSNDFMLLIREGFKNSITCQVYIINNGTEAKATTDNGITITAAYGGTRGNDLKVVCVANTDGNFDVKVYLETEVVEEYKGLKTVADLIAASTKKYVKFSATSTEAELQAFAGISLKDGANGTTENSAVTKFLDKSESVKWHTMCFPVEESELQTACITKITHLRANVGKWIQAVLPKCGSDNEGIINVTNGVVLNDGTIINAVKATAWVAGVTAGASKTESNTYKAYEGAVAVYEEKTNEEAVEAIKNGEFFFSLSEDDEVVVEYDINSLHTFTTEKTKDYSKNRCLRVYDSFATDLAKTFPPGKYDNDPEGWLVMEGLGRALLTAYGPAEQGGDGSIKNVDLENDFYVDRSRSTGDETFFNIGLEAVDSSEKHYFSVSTR